MTSKDSKCHCLATINDYTQQEMPLQYNRSIAKRFHRRTNVMMYMAYTRSDCEAYKTCGRRGGGGGNGDRR